MVKIFLNRKLHILLLITLLVFAFMAMPIPAQAEGGSIRLTYDPQVEGLEETEFTLYKVGTFSGPDLVLLDEFKESGARVDYEPPEEDASDEEIDSWRADWLTSASFLEMYLKSLGDEKPEPAAGPSVVKAGEEATFGPLENGLYLLVGSEQRVGDVYWKPVPALVMVLNGEAEYEISDLEVKMSSRSAVHDHVVRKIWDDIGHEDVRPESIKAELYYGDELYDTVILSDDNNWTYRWTTDIDEEYSWSVREYCTPKDKRLWNHYEPFVTVLDGSGEEGCETFDINNPYEADELVITKAFENTAGKKIDVKTEVKFDIKGYVWVDGEKQEFYSESATLKFDGENEKTLTISDVPIRLDELTVSETCASGTTPKDGKYQKTAEYTRKSGSGCYTVEFVNVQDDSTPPIKTGDSTQIWPLVMINISAIIALAAVLLRKRRERKE